MYRPKSIILICVSLCAFVSSVAIPSPQPENSAFPNLTLLTEEYAPISYYEDGEAKGFAVELLAATLVEAGSTQNTDDIQVIPWARAYDTALAEPFTLLFSTTYTKHRANLFHWSGFILRTQVVVFTRAERRLKVSNSEALSTLRLGVVRDDVAEQLLLSLGLNQKNIIRNTQPDYLINMLLRDRIDGFVSSTVIGNWYFERLGLNRALFEIAHVINDSTEHFVFSKNTPQIISERFKHALDNVKKRPFYQQLLRKYPSVNVNLP
ncbi:hypothetical protein CWB99_22470 [Pseudoalteromonas rubra]|uniref:Solute-binding protein family 3/N-terminal domain-containing protein n=1 Tax=Pseudoalteromonas rubra TaxID=43658 RepID=A0A5S3WG66_9GAMM|nr:transporter substrate-binding domain-containing protein [Pseudoalteromonas rubra]TMP24387.1 hypothetical protein CWB99_22470 [Pseudoalteromonas rubra]TMP30876.1 hypothetical protein CWC00_15685 [Pseudoalteromonas rubra]